MTRRSVLFVSVLSLTILVLASGASGADWPMWRYDANRSAASPHALPTTRLTLHWVRQYPALEPAWEDPVNQDRMPFDKVYEPVVIGSTLLIGSNRNDTVTALDTRTGQTKWCFYADGPVRFAPVAWQGKAYFVSDDGCLYCVNADTGDLLWKVRGGPDARKVLGNSRMISAWPARGGPVLADGTVYFGASIWPFMGIFIHAIDAETGNPVWSNDGLGAKYMKQPHGGSVSFGSVAPQGAIAAIADRLIVPGGRSVPACLNRQTGEMLYYHLSGSEYYTIGEGVDRKREGGSHVSAIGNFLLNHRGLNTSLYDLATGEMYLMWQRTTYPVLTHDVCYLSGNPVVAYDLESIRKVAYQARVKDKKTGKIKEVTKYRWRLGKLWECPVDATGALIKAGNRLYAGGINVVSALEPGEGDVPAVTWAADIDGTVARIIAADDRLFVVTLEGRLYAFGADPRTPETFTTKPSVVPLPQAVATQAKEMISSAPVDRGYCLVFGIDDGRLIEAIAKLSNFHVIAVDPDAEKVAALRRRLDAAGLYGTRVSAHVGDAATFRAPSYVAALTVCQSLEAAALGTGKTFPHEIYRSMRPYGGVAYLLPATQSEADILLHRARTANLPGAKLTNTDGRWMLTRQGALDGSAPWTHQYGDVANTAKSDDQRVRAPLGLLWFGGNTHHDVLPRHGHGPPEQVVGGRLFIEGIDCLSARDVYTGKLLWKRSFPDLGTFGIYYDRSYRDNPLDTTYNQGHIAGANVRGTNFVATADRVYLVIGGDCLVLDPATGRTMATFSLPPEADTERPPAWGYLGVYEDLLIAGAQLVRFSETYQVKPTRWHDFDTSSSHKIVAMDRYTGQVRWTRQATYAFRHNAIAAGAGKLFCIDNVPQPIIDALKRRGKTLDVQPMLMALNVQTGEPIWSVTENVFGTWLGYSAEHDILLQSGRKSRDMNAGESSNRMIAHQGADGSIVWDSPVRHSGPCMLHGDTIYLNAESSKGSAIGLLTGQQTTRTHPLTGQTLPWRYHRAYGCNSVIASEHLLTFRSGAAGYYDLIGDAGTGNLGGFKSGCTSNLIVADGVLNAPDYTRTCTCSYPNQTSLAFVHMPDVETWMCSMLPRPEAPVRRVGLNFGAPGDRLADDGTLWLDYPSVGGPSPDIPVKTTPEQPPCFRRHSSRVEGEGLRWVAASGARNLADIEITLADDAAEPRPYTVRLHFAEPDALKPGQRVFDVSLQGETVLERFDIVAQAGGSNRPVVAEFKRVAVVDTLVVGLAPAAAAPVAPPLICGIEIVADGW